LSGLSNQKRACRYLQENDAFTPGPESENYKSSTPRRRAGNDHETHDEASEESPQPQAFWVAAKVNHNSLLIDLASLRPQELKSCLLKDNLLVHVSYLVCLLFPLFHAANSTITFASSSFLITFSI
jgi:hypothetical protein